MDRQTYYVRGGHIVVSHLTTANNTKETLVHMMIISLSYKSVRIQFTRELAHGCSTCDSIFVLILVT